LSYPGAHIFYQVDRLRSNWYNKPTRGVVYSAREAHNLTGQAQLLTPQPSLFITQLPYVVCLYSSLLRWQFIYRNFE